MLREVNMGSTIIVVAMVLAANVANGCKETSFTWSVIFSPRVDVSSVASVRADVLRRGCEELDPVIERRTWHEPGGAGPEPFALRDGDWGFMAVALDANCVVLGEGCSTYKLPMRDALIETVIEPQDSRAACAEELCHEGVCRFTTDADADADHDSGADGDTDTDADADRDAPCVPDCAGRQCGPDACGGVCGECVGGQRCDEVDGLCLDDCDVGWGRGSPCIDRCADGSPCIRDTALGATGYCSSICANDGDCEAALGEYGRCLIQVSSGSWYCAFLCGIERACPCGMSCVVDGAGIVDICYP